MRDDTLIHPSFLRDANLVHIYGLCQESSSSAAIVVYERQTEENTGKKRALGVWNPK